MVFILYLLGCALGSFAYAYTLRLRDGRDWVKGRSECELCKHKLGSIDLVPVLSWLSTGGRCRYCHKKIGSSYVAVELLTGVFAVVSYLLWPYGFTVQGIVLFGLWIVMVPLLVSLLIYDLKWMELPDKTVAMLCILAVAYQLFGIGVSGEWGRLVGVVSGVGVGSGIFYVLFQASRGKYIGGGDVKYGVFYGILLGSGLKSAMVISLASLLGTVMLLPLLATKKTTLMSKIPFGPYLIVATAIVYLLGDRIIEALSTVYLFP